MDSRTYEWKIQEIDNYFISSITGLLEFVQGLTPNWIENTQNKEPQKVGKGYRKNMFMSFNIVIFTSALYNQNQHMKYCDSFIGIIQCFVKLDV